LYDFFLRHATRRKKRSLSAALSSWWSSLEVNLAQKKRRIWVVHNGTNHIKVLPPTIIVKVDNLIFDLDETVPAIGAKQFFTVVPTMEKTWMLAMLASHASLLSPRACTRGRLFQPLCRQGVTTT